MLPKFFKPMITFPKTLIIRHRRENLKKCSLSGLESREDFCFLTYPLQKAENFTDYLLLTLDKKALPLSKKDTSKGVLLLDATWKLAYIMEKNIPSLIPLERRSLPFGFQTAYPRRQHDCPDATQGLSSLEALAIAYFVLGRDGNSLLKNYYWKDLFFARNKNIFNLSEAL